MARFGLEGWEIFICLRLAYLASELFGIKHYSRAFTMRGFSLSLSFTRPWIILLFGEVRCRDTKGQGAHIFEVLARPSQNSLCADSSSSILQE